MGEVAVMKYSRLNNAEARAMAGFISGYEPEEVTNYLVIIITGEGEVKATTDMCPMHAAKVCAVAAEKSLEWVDWHCEGRGEDNNET
jgi:hypothetical protein